MHVPLHNLQAVQRVQLLNSLQLTNIYRSDAKENYVSDML